MPESLKSVGLDVGTTSTQMILSRLTVENRADRFAVPEMEITEREILYRSPVHFTPLLDESHMDGAALRQLILREYAAAGIGRGDVDTGAIIITGETSRKENAGTVLEALSDLAGDFVVAAAGPDLESVLAAKGAGAAAYSRETGKTVLHMDIGGGTSNLALIRDGKITATGCLNVGGRLVKFREDGTVTYVSPVVREFWTVPVGEKASPAQVETLAEMLTEALEMAAGLREATPLLEKLTTAEAGTLNPQFPASAGEKPVYSFSGGVADCMESPHPWLAFGDIGPVLGQKLRKSRLCAGAYRLGSETIRATVIGAGCHSAALSGSTVFCQNVALPLKNIPVVNLSEAQQGEQLPAVLEGALADRETLTAVALPGMPSPTYAALSALADRLLAAFRGKPMLLCLEQDMAKALGQALAVRSDRSAGILCIDRVKIGEGSYLDIGAPVGPAFPVVVKTLILNS